MAACKNCGAENPDDAIYCEDCGAQLSAPAAAEGPPEFSEGQTLDGRFTIEAVVEAGPITRYRAREGEQSWLVLQGGAQLSAQRALLQSLRSPWMFVPKEFLQEGDLHYAVGPWPGKERLDERVQRGGPLAAAEVEQIAHQLLEALGELHEQGLVSLAVQPSRIWLDEGQVRLDLWERAVHLEALPDESESLAVTPGFSAPEAYGLGQLSPSADLFSLAAVLHYCLSGERPNFEARETFFTVAPPPVEGAESLVYVIMKSLSKFPADRFPDAAAMKEALTQPVPLPAVVNHAPTPSPRPVPANTPAPVPAPMPEAPHSNGRIAGKKVVALKTDIGCVRSINQDACLEMKFTFFEKSQPHEGHLIVVIDGMGGEAEGDKAASIALRTIAQEVVVGSMALRDGRQTTPLLPSDPGERCRLLLHRALTAANRNIYDYASLDENRRGMGCTITCCMLLNGTAHFAHVGDTRGYHMHGKLEQVTTDHSLVGRLVAMGQLTPEEARNSPQRSIIYRAMGTNPDIEVDLYDRELSPGDRLVLCSDGVWEYFEESEFAHIVENAPEAEGLCGQLVSICLSRGADDNATVAVIDV